MNSAVGITAYILLTALSTGAAHWPQFRGPAASGQADGPAAPTTWNADSGENIRWRTPVPGLAHASPITWDDRVFVATAVKPGESELKVGLYGSIDPVIENEPVQWRLLALDLASGKVLWNTVALEAVPRVKRHPKATHCNSTPATNGKRLVALFGSEGLFCFDVAGKLLWRKDLGPMDSGYFQSKSAQWGFASSPVIHDGKVVVQCDVQEGSFLAAFDLADGRELWRAPRKDVPTWGTPTVVTHAGRMQIIVNGWHHLGGYDFATGKELWKLDGGGDIPVPTPIIGHGLVYLTSAHGKVRPMRAVRLDATGDITPPEVGATNAAIAWAHARQGNYMQTPIMVGDRLYGCSDSGVVTCFDARTGAIRFSERLPAGEGYTASPVASGGNLFFTSEQGKVYVVPAGDKFSITSTNDLGETCLATPAIANGAMLFRTRGQVVSVGNK